jgi:transposase
MSKAQLVITAVVLEGRSKSEVARDYDVSRYWDQQLVKRYQAEGAAAFEARSRRPHHNPHAVVRHPRCVRRQATAGVRWAQAVCSS